MQIYINAMRVQKERKKYMNAKELMKRCEKFFSEVELPVSVFCRKLSMSTSTFYRWRKGELDITQDRMREIDSFLRRYDF